MNLKILLRNFIIELSFLELLHSIFIILARNRIVEISVITKCRKKYNRDISMEKPYLRACFTRYYIFYDLHKVIMTIITSSV